ncbi:hypothetical protein DFJ73DRAFT_65939 [Zopfochytrium polystomum]|nr:hypothetical protein DFJ73DRAFT_65939 [Zopfochytrium polystomum]
MAAQPSALASRGSISRMRQPHSDAGSGAGKERPEKQFKEGMQLITEAFGHFSRSMTEEVDYWKQLSNLQRQQVATLEAEAQRLKQANAELERMSSSQAREIAALSEAKTSIQAECDGLRKTMNELESFRRVIIRLAIIASEMCFFALTILLKSIVSMVAQGPVSGAGPPRDSRCFDDLDGLSSTSTTVFDRRAPSRVDSAIDGSPKNVVRSVKSHFSTASAAASDSILAEPSLNATDSLDFSLTSQPYKESNAPKSRRPSVFSGGDTFESLFEVKESEYELSPGDIPTDLPDKAPIERSPFSSSARLQSRNFESDSDYEVNFSNLFHALRQ